MGGHTNHSVMGPRCDRGSPLQGLLLAVGMLILVIWHKFDYSLLDSNPSRLWIPTPVPPIAPRHHQCPSCLPLLAGTYPVLRHFACLSCDWGKWIPSILDIQEPEGLAPGCEDL